MSRTPGSREVSPADANATARRASCLDLRVAGMTQAEIGRRVGLSQSQVSRAIRQALAERTAAGVDELRAVESARLDALHRAFWVPALKADVGAAHVTLKAMDRRSKLLGLDLGGPGDGGVVHHDYFASVAIHITDEASAELAAWEVEQTADTAWQTRADAPVPAHLAVNTSVPLPAGTTQAQAVSAVAEAVAQAAGPLPPDAPPLQMRLVIMARHYRPYDSATGQHPELEP
jgi:DNA-binding CsgD family transcriptional regulator